MARTAGAHPGELASQRLQRSLHPTLGILEHGWAGIHRLTSVTEPPSLTNDPTPDSPRTIRSRFPGMFRSKTPIGSLFSMQSEIAVVSITRRPRLSTSM